MYNKKWAVKRVKKAEGRGQKAEGSNMVGASDPLPIASHQNGNFGGGLKPLLPAVARSSTAEASADAAGSRPSAFCLRTSAFPDNG